jgi:hypothetical protein
MVLLVPINVAIASVSKRFQAMQMKHKDKRIKIMSEILHGIKVGYNWIITHIHEYMHM